MKYGTLNILLFRLSEKEKIKRNNYIEQYMLKGPSFAANYAGITLEGRFDKGEDIISASPYFSFYYARTAIGGRFEKGEASISLNPYFSFMYATKILNDRFEIGEPAIMGSIQHRNNYLIFLDEIGLDDVVDHLRRLYEKCHEH